MKKKTPFKLFIFWTLACRYFIFQPKKNVYTTTWKNPCGNFFMALARPQPGKTGTQLGYRGRTKPYIYIIYISYILILLTNILNWIWFWDYTETKYELFKKLSTEFTIALLFIKNKSVKHAVQINQKIEHFIPTSKMTDSKSNLQIWFTYYRFHCLLFLL